MKRAFNYIMIIVGVAFLATSCVSPDDPTPTMMAPGEWEVDEFYVNGETQTSSDEIDRFTLERNGTFILEDANGLLFSGSWNASSSTLTLTAADGTVWSFQIIFMTYNKMQIVQTVTTGAGDITITYLMNRNNADTY